MPIAHKCIDVNAPIDQVYRMWSNFENFPSFMENIEEVTPGEANVTHWKARIMGTSQEWDAEATAMEENKRVAWRSLGGVKHDGEVNFERSDFGTHVCARIEYEMPGGVAGDIGERLGAAGPVESEIEEDMQNFKQMAESRAAM